MRILILDIYVEEAIEALVKYCGDAKEAEDFIENPHSSHIYLEALRTWYALGHSATPLDNIEELIKQYDFEDETQDAMRKAATFVELGELRQTLGSTIESLSDTITDLRRIQQREILTPMKEAIESGSAEKTMHLASKYLFGPCPDVVDKDSAEYKRTWTVIGYYPDNNQPWMERGNGADPEEAIRDATKNLEAEVKIIEVVQGTVHGLLGSSTILSGSDYSI